MSETVDRTVSRRAWLASYLRRAGELAADHLEKEIEQRVATTQIERRPPGAVAEPLFLTLCDGCSDCVEACLHDAILTYPATAGARAGSPAMRPDRRACHLCEAYPCITACPTGALRESNKTGNCDETAHVWSLGQASLDTERCFAYAGPECGACVGICPRGIEAIQLVAWRPVLNADECVGCGLCIEACPMTPAAISMLDPRTDDQGWRHEEATP